MSLTASSEDQQVDHPAALSRWHRFVLRHTNTTNIYIHLVSAMMFWGGPLLTALTGEWLYLLLFFASGGLGTFGHWITKDSSVNFKEATHSWEAVLFSTAMAIRFVSGKFSHDIRLARSNYQRYGLGDDDTIRPLW